MTDNPTFVQALADATQRPVEISRCARRPRSAPRSSRASPSATTRRSTRSRPRGTRGRPSSRPACSTASGGARGRPVAAVDPGAVRDRLLNRAATSRQRPAVTSSSAPTSAALRSSASWRAACMPSTAGDGADDRARARAARDAGRERHREAVDRVGDRARAHPLRVLRALLHRRDGAHTEHDLAGAEHPGEHPGRRRRRVPSEEEAQHDAGQRRASPAP